ESTILNAQELNKENYYGSFGKKVKITPAFFSQIDTFSLFQSGQNQTWNFSNLIYVDSVTNPSLFSTTESKYFMLPEDAEFINNCSDCPGGKILPDQFSFGLTIENRAANQTIEKQEIYYKK